MSDPSSTPNVRRKHRRAVPSPPGPPHCRRMPEAALPDERSGATVHFLLCLPTGGARTVRRAAASGRWRTSMTSAFGRLAVALVLIAPVAPAHAGQPMETVRAGVERAMKVFENPALTGAGHTA